uniref:Hydrophobin n=2 Tax=Tricholoma TaxID=40144 RepID=A0A024BL34_9AGAR|nr:hydrophobin 5 [Tricholoma vaccinum]
MFSKIALFVATVVAFVAATPIPDAASSPQCNTGPIQCCQSVYQSQTTSHSILANLVGLDVQSLTASIGTQCSPLTVGGLAAGAKCSQQPVCCSGNNFSGLIVVGCSPINL